MTNGRMRVGAVVSSLSLAGPHLVAGAVQAAPQAVTTPRATVGISGPGVQASAPAAPAPLHVAAGPPSFGVPVEIRAITGDARSPQAVLVNTGSRDIHVFELGVYRPGRDGTWEFVGSSGQSGIDGWRPGEERRSSAAGWRRDEGSVLVPTVAFFGDGTAMGRPEAIERARSESRAHLEALQALQEAFDTFPDPVGGDQLQALIEQMALALARAPFTPQGRGNHAFLDAMNELKRLASPSRPEGTPVEDGVAQARQRVATSLDVQRRLPVLMKDPSVQTPAAVP